MKVLVDDGLSISTGTGICRYVRGLCTGASEIPEMKLDLYSPRWFKRIPTKSGRRIAYSLNLEGPLQRRIKRDAYQFVHFANYYVPLRKPKRVKYAVTIHDLTPWYFPEVLPSQYCWYLRRTVSKALKRADLVFTGSEFIKGQICSTFNLAPANVHVTHYGVDPAFYGGVSGQKGACKHGICQTFRIILFVGTLEKRKNLEVLIKGFELIAQGVPDVLLILAGKPGYGAEELARLAKESGAANRILFWGYAPEAELLSLYKRAAVFVFPSKYEGFGIPIIEAMAAGVPVVVSDIPAHREVVGDNGLYFPQQCCEGAARQIHKVLADNQLASKLAGLGRERANLFSWREVAVRHLAGYRAVL